MFTDIVGYTALMDENEEQAFQLLEKNRKIHKPIIKKYRGKWLKEMGDGVLASFHTITDAVYCAIEIQNACKPEPDLKLRIGIHQGEVTFQGEDVFGSGVNIASRLEELAPVGGIYISESVYRNVQNKTGIRADFVREETLKNVKHSVKIFEVVFEEDLTLSNQRGERRILRSNLFKLITGIIILLIVAGLIWIKFPVHSKKEIDPNAEKSIALLPFKNLSEDQSNQYFCDGVMEGILNNLSQIKDLRVLSRNSTEQYRERTIPSPQIAKELDVNYLVEASVFKSENRIRVTAQLIDARNDEHIWSKQYDREISDIFSVMSDVSKEVASEVQANIDPEVKERIETIPTENQEAYDLFLRGKEYHERSFNGIEINKSALSTAIHFYKQAIELDPKFALAYIWLGGAYQIQVGWHGQDYLKESYLDTFKYYLDKALEIDPELPEGLVYLGSYNYAYGDFNRSIELFEKAIELRSNYSDAYWYLADSYKAENDYVNSIINYKKAQKLVIGTDEYPQILIDLGNAYHDISYYSKAESHYKELVQYDPIRGYYWLSNLAENNAEWKKMRYYTDQTCAIDSGFQCQQRLSAWYTYENKIDSALIHLKKIKELQAEITYNIWSSYKQGYILYKLGKREAASDLFARQIELSKETIRLNRGQATGSTGGFAYYSIAACYAVMGENEKAIEALHEMEQNAFSGWYAWKIQHDPMFDILRGDEEFEAIIQRQEKKYADIRTEIDRLEEKGQL